MSNYVTQIGIELDPAEIANQLSRDELVQLIMDIDDQVCDWSFTEELYRLFKDQHKVHKAELKEDNTP